MVINSSITAFAETYDNVDLISNYGVVIDYETGQVLGGKNIDSKVYPASTTKIWTAYLTVKNTKNLDEPIEITEPPGVDGSCMYLEVGEIFTVRELLQGLLIHSSNDAAVVLAKYVSGSVEEFANLMNEEAKKAGALNTHFNNPHGLPDENHYTTPYDMAMLARKAMSEKEKKETKKAEKEDLSSKTLAELKALAKEKGVKLMLPVDTKIGKEFKADTESKTVLSTEIPEGWEGFDIGEQTIKEYEEELKKAKTVVWNGPMGVFENPILAKGTIAVAQALADTDATTIIGGGDSAAAVNQLGFADKMTHISTGGGASLEFLEGKDLPGVVAANDK